jgi:hypothetical protein
MVKKLLDELSQKSYEKEEHITSMVEYADLLGRKIDLNSDQLMEIEFPHFLFRNKSKVINRQICG